MDGNTGRLLGTMQNRGFRIMPDIVTPAGYFSFIPSKYDEWAQREHGSITVDSVMNAVIEAYPDNEYRQTYIQAAYAKEYGVPFGVYEGGQHVAPNSENKYKNNPNYHHFDSAIWDAQFHPDMFNMYMTNFRSHTLPHVDCQIFMAFAFVGLTKTIYGSFGHLDGDQFNQEKYLEMDSVIFRGPKYNALLYSTKPKADYLRAPTAQLRLLNNNQVEVTLQTESQGGIIYYSLDGKYPFTLRYTAPLVLPAGSMVYAVTAKAGYAYSNTSKILVRMEPSPAPDVLLPQGTSRRDVVLYPNPVSDYLNVALTAPQQGTVTVYSITGTPVFWQTFDADYIRVNLTSLPSGYYVVKVNLPDRPPYTVKIKRQ